MLRFIFRRLQAGNPATAAMYGRAGTARSPSIDVVEVQDDPSQGFLIRVVYHNRCVEVSHYPQLGPRKSDPMDPMPQFDFTKRAFIRYNKSHVCDMLAVMENRQTTSANETMYGAKSKFTKVSNGYTIDLELPMKGQSDLVRAVLQFKNHHASLLRYFLEFSLQKSFGFDDMPVDLATAPRSRQPYRDGQNREASNEAKPAATTGGYPREQRAEQTYYQRGSGNGRDRGGRGAQNQRGGDTHYQRRSGNDAQGSNYVGNNRQGGHNDSRAETARPEAPSALKSDRLSEDW